MKQYFGFGVLIGIVIIIVVWGYPQYHVYSQRLEGQASLV